MGADQPPDQATEALHDPGNLLGLWWARLSAPETLERVAGSLVSLLFVLIVVVIVYVGAMLLFRRALGRLGRDLERVSEARRRRLQRIMTVLELLRSIARWVILIAGAIWMLAVLGLNIAPVLAGAGIVGLAVGFGAQNLVRDLVSGFFILLEGQYAVGDYVRVGTMFGMVETVGIRVTVLRDLNNQLHYLPNGTITSVTVYAQPFVGYVVEARLAAEADAARAAETVEQAAAAVKAEFPRHLVEYGRAEAVADAAESAVRIPAAALPSQEWIVTEELCRRVRQMLEAAGIALQEGVPVRAYVDLSHMPVYDAQSSQVRSEA